MKISQHIHQQIRLKNLLSTALILCLLGTLAWLSNRYTIQTDVTSNAGNTLSPASQKLLESLPDKIQITAYIKKDPALRSQISQLVDRYKRHKPNLTLTYIDPDSQPEKTRELNIASTGIILVEYQG
ncbi:MAG: Gldg family protein, partial [Methylobacter sp.]|nr:Gldg family protein [Methylobacter sp.]